MTPEDGTGLADADTYIDPTAAFAAGYVASHLYASAWNTASTPEREAACIMATRTLDGLMEWNGTRKTTTQALGWPRYGFSVDGVSITGLPTAIKSATVEMALALLTNNRTSDTGSGEAEVTSIALGSGALKIDLGSDPTVAPVESRNIIPPFIRRMLRAYGETSGGGMTAIERR